MTSTTAYSEKRDKQNEKQNQTLADLANRLFPEKDKSIIATRVKSVKATKGTKKIS